MDVATGQLTINVTGIKSASGWSAPSPPFTSRVGGTWGAPSAPTLLRAVAQDAGRNPGLDTGDTLVLVFDQPVYPLPLDAPAALANLLAFSPPLCGQQGVACSAAWLNSSALVVSLTCATPADGRPWLQWNVGLLVVSVLPSADLRSANNESAASNTSVVVGDGAWGDVPSARVVSKSSTAAVVTLFPPATAALPVPMVCVVQWASDGGAFASVPPLPLSVTEAVAWADAAPVVSSLQGLDGDSVLGSVVLAPGLQGCVWLY